MKRNLGEKGIALVLSLASITLFAILASGFVAVGVRNTQVGSDYEYGTEALSTAEAGVHFALGQMNAGEIVPPKPILGDPTWVDWVENLVTPGYESTVQIKYVPDLMLPHFDSATGWIEEEDKYYRITSRGEGPRKTEKKLEVIMSPDGSVLGPKFTKSWQFGLNIKFAGGPVTFSANSDTMVIKLDGGDARRPYIETIPDDYFDEDNEWGLRHGEHVLKEIEWSHKHPDDSLFFPPVEGLHSGGDIHSNETINIQGKLRINGRVTTSEVLLPDPFNNDEDSYILNGWSIGADPQFLDDIPTDSAFWASIAKKRPDDVYFITPSNVGDYPGWQYVGGTFKWTDSGRIPDATYYFTDDVHISGNPATSAIIITDDDIQISGHPTNWGDDVVGYVAGKDFVMSGNLYLRGIIYAKGTFNSSGSPSIFGAVYVGGENGGGPPKVVSGSPIIIYDTALQYKRWVILEPLPAITSWQEVYE